MKIIKINEVIYNLESFQSISKINPKQKGEPYSIKLDCIEICFYPNIDEKKYIRKTGFTLNDSITPAPEGSEFNRPQYDNDFSNLSKQIRDEEFNRIEKILLK